MKLNIGCGKIYKEGFINIDAFDSTVADKIMSADDLKFSSNTVERIEASQIIEHFGLMKSIYILAEWFRVLKPGGILLIETPDLVKSFKEFIEGDLETRKKVLTWIYGVESKGMMHSFCFPTDLLEMILEKTGFIVIEKSFYEKEENHPTQKIVCKKIKEYQPYQIIATFRKRLISKKIVEPQNYYITLEQEKLFDLFLEKIKQFCKEKKYEILDEIVIEGSVQNIKMTEILLEECINHKLVMKKKVNIHIETIKFLEKVDFLTILLHLIKESSDDAGTQNKIFKVVTSVGKQSVKKLLTEDAEKLNVKDSLLKLSKECVSSKTVFLSYDLLEREAADLYYYGLKEFILGNYNKAIDRIKKAISIDRNHLLYYWNLGKLLSLTRNKSEAKSNYKNAIKLVKVSKYKEKKKLEEKLKQEMINFSSKKHGKPVTEILN